MRRPLVRTLALLTLVFLGGCAYFNALYNARRLYRDAEAAAGRGETHVAEAAYRESLEKAARSLERDPAGRWADDALLLVGQNHFALGDCRAAHAALSRVVGESRDARLLARARAWLGAAAPCNREPQEALAHFAAAIPDLDPEGSVAAFARLWRARARFDLGAPDSAWADLEAVGARGDALGRAALLEHIARALENDRRDLVVAPFHLLFEDPAGDTHADSIRALAVAVSLRWGGALAREALEPAAGAPWAGQLRDRLVVERARQAGLAGDTSLALRELEQAASRSTDHVATDARVEIARLRLANAQDPAELSDIRATVLPAIGDTRVRPIVNAIGLVAALLAQAQQGQPLALFAAAEVARDRLRAPALARRLFVGYADVAGSGGWSSKAILAALALDPPPAEAAALSARIESAGDPYALAARGQTPAGFEDAERRLDQVLVGLINRASVDAQQRDLAIADAIAEMDSLSSAVRADSISLACGFLADSLGLAGIRRDSVGAACLREDVALVDSFLRVDTMLLRDTVSARPPAARPDTASAAEDIF